MKTLQFTSLRIILACAFFSTVISTTLHAASPVVSSVTAQQQSAPSTTVDIYYDLQDSDGDTCAVMVDVSTNSGTTYNIRASNCSGDIGDAVTPGTSKHITWDAIVDLPNFVSSTVRVKVWAFDAIHKSTADPDVEFRAAWKGVDPNLTLEWDLQSIGTVDNVQYSPFYCSETEITAAQFCRFLNEWKNRFADKTAPACVVTSVMNTAQGGQLFEVHAPGTWLICKTRTTALTDHNNSYSKIKWDGTQYTLNSTGTETNEPMTEVSWYGAVAYCQWLNEKEFGTNPANWKYRLPTEWEYEFLMGAHSYSMSSGVQDWGSSYYLYGQSHDTISRTAWANDYGNYGTNNWYQGTVTVGKNSGPGGNARNIFGMYDLSGNVCSWCLDWWTGSVTPAGKDFVNSTKGASINRSARGGHWTFDSNLCDVRTYRFAGNPSALNSRFGFVVVREL